MSTRHKATNKPRLFAWSATLDLQRSRCLTFWNRSPSNSQTQHWDPSETHTDRAEAATHWTKSTGAILWHWNGYSIDSLNQNWAYLLSRWALCCWNDSLVHVWTKKCFAFIIFHQNHFHFQLASQVHLLMDKIKSRPSFSCTEQNCWRIYFHSQIITKKRQATHWVEWEFLKSKDWNCICL